MILLEQHPRWTRRQDFLQLHTVQKMASGRDNFVQSYSGDTCSTMTISAVGQYGLPQNS